MELKREITIENRQRIFRAAGLVLLCDSIFLVLSRIAVNLIVPYITGVDEATNEIIIDVIFSTMSQIISLLVIPLLIYKFYLKKPTKEIFVMSGFKKTDKRIYILSFFIGICAFICTIGVSYVWQVILMLMGFDGSSSTVMPEKFQWWHLLLSLLLTAVFPAVCEEFANRGILLGAIRNSFNPTQTILLGGLIFGLFHQYISQTFYTALMGMLLTYLILKTRSIYPAMIIHFTNNALAVATDFIGEYLPSTNFLVVIGDFLTSDIAIMFLLVLMAAFLLFFLLKKVNACYGEYYTDIYAKFMKYGDESEYDKVTTFWTGGNIKYKPVLRDWIFWIGGFIITIAYTLFTFFWGFF